jgi:hypothetical protein
VVRDDRRDHRKGRKDDHQDLPAPPMARKAVPRDHPMGPMDDHHVLPDLLKGPKAVHPAPLTAKAVLPADPKVQVDNVAQADKIPQPRNGSPMMLLPLTLTATGNSTALN